jgi:hypothetical protein
VGDWEAWLDFFPEGVASTRQAQTKPRNVPCAVTTMNHTAGFSRLPGTK